MNPIDKLKNNSTVPIYAGNTINLPDQSFRYSISSVSTVVVIT